MKKLQLTFLNAEGKQHRWTPKAADQELTGEVVKAAMEGIVAAGMFEKNGIPHCTGVVGAKYIEVIETILFDMEAVEQA